MAEIINIAQQAPAEPLTYEPDFTCSFPRASHESEFYLHDRLTFWGKLHPEAIIPTELLEKRGWSEKEINKIKNEFEENSKEKFIKDALPDRPKARLLDTKRERSIGDPDDWRKKYPDLKTRIAFPMLTLSEKKKYTYDDVIDTINRALKNEQNWPSQPLQDFLSSKDYEDVSGVHVSLLQAIRRGRRDIPVELIENYFREFIPGLERANGVYDITIRWVIFVFYTEVKTSTDTNAIIRKLGDYEDKIASHNTSSSKEKHWKDICVVLSNGVIKKQLEMEDYRVIVGPDPHHLPPL